MSTKNQYSFRPGIEADIPQFAELLVLIWRTAYNSFLPASFLNSLNVAKQVKRYQNAFSKGHQYLVVEKLNGQIIGFCSWGDPRDQSLSADNELYTLYVAPAHQGNGIGKQLLNNLENNFLKNKGNYGVEVMRLNPYLPFYTKNGFVRQGTSTMELSGEIIENLILVKELALNH